jgi:hypothetical protein
MSLIIEEYTRKPFNIEAVQVTRENMEEVAKWCGGVVQLDAKNKRYIKVDVNLPLTEKQTKAYLDDWVLKSDNRGKGRFKVYTHKAFVHCFDKIEKDFQQDELPLDVKPAPKIHMPAGYPEPSTR